MAYIERHRTHGHGVLGDEAKLAGRLGATLRQLCLVGVWRFQRSPRSVFSHIQELAKYPRIDDSYRLSTAYKPCQANTLR